MVGIALLVYGGVIVHKRGCKKQPAAASGSRGDIESANTKKQTRKQEKKPLTWGIFKSDASTSGR